MADSNQSKVVKDAVKIGTIYVCEAQGRDLEGTGTEKMPFLSLQKAVAHVKGNVSEYDYLVRKAILDPYEPAAKAGLKKAVKGYDLALKKAAKDAEKAIQDLSNAAEKAAAEQLKLDEARSVVLVQDQTLAPAKKIQLHAAAANRGSRVKVSGWVHRLRVQGKDMMFIVLRDGYGLLQCVLTGQQCHTYSALTLTLESTVTIYGQILALPDGKSVSV